MKDRTTGDGSKKFNGHIIDEKYLTCIKIWNEFSMKNMGGYHNHYLIKDVLLLADVSERFTSTCLTFYKLDPGNYFSSPWLSKLGCDVKNDWNKNRKNFRRWHVFIYWKKD